MRHKFANTTILYFCSMVHFSLTNQLVSRRGPSGAMALNSASRFGLGVVTASVGGAADDIAVLRWWTEGSTQRFAAAARAAAARKVLLRQARLLAAAAVAACGFGRFGQGVVQLLWRLTAAASPPPPVLQVLQVLVDRRWLVPARCQGSAACPLRKQRPSVPPQPPQPVDELPRCHSEYRWVNFKVYAQTGFPVPISTCG
eukprot:SAG31_NODE_3510_length_4179_cov_6.712500_1_plen_200_part_00